MKGESIKMKNNIPTEVGEKKKNYLLAVILVVIFLILVIPYEIDIHKGNGFDIKSVLWRVSHNKNFDMDNGEKKIKIRWFSFD